MYLYLGQDTVILSRFVVGIFDLDNTTTSKHTRKFLAQAEQQGGVVTVGSDLPKSFVVYEEHGNTTVFLSQIAPSTLRKRAYSK